MGENTYVIARGMVLNIGIKKGRSRILIGVGSLSPNSNQFFLKDTINVVM